LIQLFIKLKYWDSVEHLLLKLQIYAFERQKTRYLKSILILCLQGYIHSKKAIEATSVLKLFIQYRHNVPVDLFHAYLQLPDMDYPTATKYLSEKRYMSNSHTLYLLLKNINARYSRQMTDQCLNFIFCIVVEQSIQLDCLFLVELAHANYIQKDFFSILSIWTSLVVHHQEQMDNASWNHVFQNMMGAFQITGHPLRVLLDVKMPKFRMNQSTWSRLLQLSIRNNGESLFKYFLLKMNRQKKWIPLRFLQEQARAKEASYLVEFLKELRDRKRRFY
jgi:hypothetical protein